VDAQPEALGDSFKSKQTGVLLNPKLVKLIQLIPNVARFGGLFLGPAASQPEFPQTLPEPD
jgi:hypothetical protein